MTIIDAQVHVWPPETAERPYIKKMHPNPIDLSRLNIRICWAK